MSEETAAPVAETKPTPEPTLEDVYKEAETAAPAAPVNTPQYTPSTATQTYTPPQVPDPYDSDNFKAYLSQQAQGVAATQDAVRQLAGFLNQQQQREAQAVLQKDLSQAVETVNAKVGHPNPKVIEAMLDAEARSDTRFKALWENRSKNPDAWNKAVGAFANKAVKEFDFKVDPALADAQRARKLAQSKMSTTDAPQSEVEEWESMSVEEQQTKMDRLLNASL